MQAGIWDTSVYISVLRLGQDAVLAARRTTNRTPLWLSAVVLQELYAGAGDRERRVVARLERDFDSMKRILVPSLSDWSRAGIVLARLAAKYGYETIGRARLTNDALIAVSAGRVGMMVLTANTRDYRRLQEFHPFQWQLTTI